MWMFADVPGASRPQPPMPQPQGAAAAGAGEEEDDVVEQTNDLMSILLPWLTSILFHLGIVVLALFSVWSIVQVEEEAPIIPIARLSEKPGAKLQSSQDVTLKSEVVRETKTEKVTTEDTLVVSNSANQLELVGVAGGASGGKIAPLGTVSSGNPEVSRFYGTGGNARKIIYVVDASGSLIDTLPFVIKELKKSINELSDKQQFTVIFFQSGDAIEVPPIGWKPATAEIKKQVADWVTLDRGNIIPHGATNPVKAIQLAMRLQPELVYILSDNITGKGRYEIDKQELVKLLDGANKNRKIAINTIQFLYPDPLGTLEEIAKTHGGSYTFVRETDLGLR
jgi:hypothetical protein